MKKFLYLLAVLHVLLYSCVKEEKIDYTDKNAPAPAQVSNVNTTAQPGAAVLKYKLPADANLSYVKAVYEIQPGVFREAMSSAFIDTMALVGFGDTNPHQVKLYSVGKNQKASEPLSITVTPLTPPVLSAFSKLDLAATFGGVKVAFENAHKANLSIVVMVDSTGKDVWSPVTTFYTKALKGTFAARGYQSTAKKFAVYLRDRWNNKSDTLIKTLTPMFEQEIPKAPFKPVYLPTDTYQYVENFSLPGMWDGKLGYNMFASLHTSEIPQWFTIDLGAKITLSRFKAYQYHESPYAGASVKSFEIWGSNNPNLNGSWDGWQLLGKFESFKPSGLPFGSVSAEDVSYAVSKGEDFEFDSAPPVRYIRFKTLETHGNTRQVVIVELNFWGQITP